MSISGRISVDMLRMLTTPNRTISIAITMNVYGLRSATRTSHIETSSERSTTCQADSFQDATLLGREGAACVQHCLVVPVHDVPDGPLVCVAEALLEEVRAQLFHQLRALGRRETHD